MQGEWFSWLSHDDVYYPEKIQSAVDCINENGFQNNKTIIMCSSCVIDENGKHILSHSNNSKDVFTLQLKCLTHLCPEDLLTDVRC